MSKPETTSGEKTFVQLVEGDDLAPSVQNLGPLLCPFQNALLLSSRYRGPLVWKPAVICWVAARSLDCRGS